MKLAKDLSGQKFGLLIVTRRAANCHRSGSVRWHCKCACGTETTVFATNLRSGSTKSCGCKRAKYLKLPISKKQLWSTENEIPFIGK